jgi:predicted dehydrogenase
MVGFNRRFSPAAQRIKEIVSQRQNPLMVLYRVNAGYLPSDHWVHGPEGGGRILGEGCHMLDLFNFLVDAPIESVCAEALAPRTEHLLSSNNVSVTVRYTDGSVCTLFYTALGAPDLSKEYLEIYVDGKVLVVDDFKSFRVYGGRHKGWSSAVADKGHCQALEAFAQCVNGGRNWPISLSSLISASRMSIKVARP